MYNIGQKMDLDLSPYLVNIPAKQAYIENAVGQIEVSFRLLKSVEYSYEDFNFHLIVSSLSAALVAIAKNSCDYWEFYDQELLLIPESDEDCKLCNVLKARISCRAKSCAKKEGDLNVH